MFKEIHVAVVVDGHGENRAATDSWELGVRQELWIRNGSSNGPDYLYCRFYKAHFTDERTEAQQGLAPSDPWLGRGGVWKPDEMSGGGTAPIHFRASDLDQPGEWSSLSQQPCGEHSPCARSHTKCCAWMIPLILHPSCLPHFIDEEITQDYTAGM